MSIISSIHPTRRHAFMLPRLLLSSNSPPAVIYDAMMAISDVRASPLGRMAAEFTRQRGAMLPMADDG